ncbi:unnamed protein product [Ilex paraguariensis]|uniref:Uncharacterized protein n=1 Tax=Ilex paraguariensis TaxID=185542 RepID=A0ABC8RXR9_9AQUA
MLIHTEQKPGSMFTLAKISKPLDVFIFSFLDSCHCSLNSGFLFPLILLPLSSTCATSINAEKIDGRNPAGGEM